MKGMVINVQPTYQKNNTNNKNKARTALTISASVLTAIIIIVLAIGSMSTGDDTNVNIGLNNTATPYGTEVITPFYTPTKEPDRTPRPTFTPDPDGSTPVVITPGTGGNTSTNTNTSTPAANSTPSPYGTEVPIDTTKVYEKGDSGNDILMLQKMLIAMGFDPGTADGQYGSQMKDAVEQFQMYAGLSDDGAAGPDTINQIISNYNEYQPKAMSDSPVLKGIVIGIDAGHQKHANTSKEPISPNSSKTAIKADDGTYGRWTEANEYSINLQVALKLKIELEALGATVIMTRETNDVDISNSSRAQLMNGKNVDCWVQIYCNGNDDSSKRGMMILLPKTGCMNTSDSSVYSKSEILGDTLLKNARSATGAKDAGELKLDVLTSFNWSKYPVCLIELGYMTNQTDDKLLVTKEYQSKIVSGLVDGFVEYFTDTTN